MESRTAARARVARDLMKCLDQQDFRTWLPSGAEARILVALVDDTVGDTFERVRRHGCTIAHIAIMEGQRISLISTWPSDDELNPIDLDDDQIVQRGSEMGMLLALLRERRKPMRMSIDTDVEVELVDPGGELLFA